MAKKARSKEAPKYDEEALLVFISRHNAKLRSIVDTISRFDASDVDRRTMMALSNSVPLVLRARAAFEVIAWHHIIRPYTNPKHHYTINLTPFRDLVYKNAEALYLYAITVEVTPSPEIQKRLKALHPQVARDYKQYCDNFTAASQKIEDFSWAISW